MVRAKVRKASVKDHFTVHILHSNVTSAFCALSFGNVPPTMYSGLGTRIIMIGTLTGLQWWIYGSFKNLMGFGTS